MTPTLQGPPRMLVHGRPLRRRGCWRSPQFPDKELEAQRGYSAGSEDDPEERPDTGGEGRARGGRGGEKAQEPGTPRVKGERRSSVGDRVTGDMCRAFGGGRAHGPGPRGARPRGIQRGRSPAWAASVRLLSEAWGAERSARESRPGRRPRSMASGGQRGPGGAPTLSRAAERRGTAHTSSKRLSF